MSRFSRGRAPYRMEGNALFTFEIVAVAYFAVHRRRCHHSRAPRAAGHALAPPASSLAARFSRVARFLGPDARAWLAHVYLVAGYWLPALLVTRSPAGSRRGFAGPNPAPLSDCADAAAPRRLREVAYLCCYPSVPAAFLIVLSERLDRVTSIASGRQCSAAGYLCYISPAVAGQPSAAGARGRRGRRIAGTASERATCSIVSATDGTHFRAAMSPSRWRPRCRSQPSQRAPVTCS